MSRLIICDVDNTLLFTNRLNNEAYKYAARSLGLALPDSVMSAERITSNLIAVRIPLPVYLYLRTRRASE